MSTRGWPRGGQLSSSSGLPSFLQPASRGRTVRTPSLRSWALGAGWRRVRGPGLAFPPNCAQRRLAALGAGGSLARPAAWRFSPGAPRPCTRWGPWTGAERAELGGVGELGGRRPAAGRRGPATAPAELLEGSRLTRRDSRARRGARTRGGDTEDLRAGGSKADLTGRVGDSSGPPRWRGKPLPGAGGKATPGGGGVLRAGGRPGGGARCRGVAGRVLPAPRSAACVGGLFFCGGASIWRRVHLGGVLLTGACPGRGRRLWGPEAATARTAGWQWGSQRGQGRGRDRRAPGRRRALWRSGALGRSGWSVGRGPARGVYWSPGPGVHSERWLGARVSGALS